MSVRSKIIIALLGILLNTAPVYAQSSQSTNTATNTTAAQKTATIGVLAFRGNESAHKQWAPLATFLSNEVKGWNFDILPVTLTSVEREIDTNRIEFLITNPGHYVTLAAKYDLAALATRERWSKLANDYFSKFGTVVLVKKNSNIASLNDVKGKKVAAVSPNAFGGFQVAWSELKEQGVDMFRDLQSLRFVGFPHDQIITAVAEREVDVGIVRSGLLEILADEGKIRLEDFRVLNQQDQLDFPYQVSSSLFTEWPLAALPSTDKKLREMVLVTLLRSQDPAIVAKYGLEDIWSAPQPYENARNLVEEFELRLASAPDQSGFKPNILFILLGIISLIALMTLAGYAYQRRSKFSMLPNQNDGPNDDQNNASAEFQLYKEKFRSLTVREQQILQLVCSGNATKTIATELGISPKTVEFHRTNLLQKTEAGTTAHLVQIATHLGYDQGVSLG